MDGSPSGAHPAIAVLCPRPVPHARLRLYLAHHAGGSHSTFRPWVPLFPEDWEIRLLVAPGRMKSASFPAARDLTVVSEALATRLAAEDGVPYALFGHSMGGLIAFDAALRLQERAAPPPLWVGVSGHPGPFFSITRAAPPLYGLPPEELRSALIRLDGLPERVLRDRHLWERVRPLVRDDLEAAETWRPEPPAVLHCPLSAFCGERDPVADATDAAHWARHSPRFLGVRAFPGGHFYFQDNPEPVVRHITADIRTALATQPVPQE